MLTKPHATIYLSSWISASSHYLQIESDVNTLRCREKGEVRVRYTVDGPGSRQFYYKIVVSNHIVDVGSIEQQLTEEEYQQLPSTDSAKPVASFNLQFDVTPEMAPLLHVLVYHVVNYNGTKEVIADTKKINVEKCFPQKVTMQFAAQQQLPGAAEKLTIRGSPNSLCAVGVVDKSVTLLGDSTSITADKIFAKVIPATNRRRSYIRAWEYCASKYGPPNGPEEIPPPPIPGLQGPPGPPGPVAFPAIVEPVIRTSRHSLYWTFTNNVDSRLAFQNLGLTVMSDMEVDARPCVSRERRWRYYMRTGSRGPGSAGGIQPMPMAAPGPEVVTMEVDYDNDGGPEESSTTAAEQDIRTYFPETWLWDLYRLDHSGQVDVHTEVPDTITDWVGGGYCTSVDAGFGVSPPLSLRAFQPFFISYTLPYSAVRNERIPLIVSVFNYLSDSLTIELTLEDSDAFEVFSDKQVALCASGGTATTHRYMIRPQLLGEVNVTVHALSLPTTNLICGNEVAMSETGAGVRDAITQRLLVEAEGVEKAYSVSMFACPHRESGGVFTDVMDLALPSEDLVPDSGRATVSVIGDVMGSALQNLDALLTMPYGCGEQNMITFAPDIYIMQYLTATGQATDAISKKALTYMRAGYQRELTYRHDDGAYSAFGNRDKEGSMWLTAFVVRSFAEARPFIFIDDAQIAASVEWIARRQGEDGCFPVVGTLHHKGMKGGVGDARTKATLTAYVATSLIAATMPAVQEPIAAALSCIERESFSDAYTLALVAYMYARHGDSARSGEYLARLMDLAIEDTSLKTLHWEKPNAEVVDTSLHWNRQAEKKAINPRNDAYASADDDAADRWR
ncbi:PREDICTED: alpha-2-macroglobulin-like isoform X2 [Priapulus caudatus]|uniref:Alpha-2-macroglobulin-like isoform X2 n=1 Tax=Priapulus caudatus TaxID=37621 RepID=A0ABM1EAP1_PRICU|nr:PREDICTED: alpha-2-macroglobulin-like isoform X2 [Priapulus caudatus]